MAASSLKITVVKKLVVPDLVEKYGEGVDPECPAVEVGQEFMVEGWKMPEGFCAWAWADIHRDLTVLACGGDFPWIKEPGVMISCCTDGLRPVVFKLERVPG
jgi:uncharacterized repeat protein (TIGR04076 family)